MRGARSIGVAALGSSSGFDITSTTPSYTSASLSRATAV